MGLITQDLINYTWIVLFLIIMMIRKYHERKAGKRTSLKDTPVFEALLMILWGVAAGLVPFFYIFADWIDFANYAFAFSMPIWLIGVLLFLVATWMVHRSHADLGKMWSSQLTPEKGGRLVKEGVYKRIRHPMYSGHLLWGVAQMMLFPNYLAGPLALVLILILLVLRIPREEKLLLQEFGEEYRQYIASTGRVFPRLRS